MLFSSILISKIFMFNYSVGSKQLCLYTNLGNKSKWCTNDVRLGHLMFDGVSLVEFCLLHGYLGWVINLVLLLTCAKLLLIRFRTM